MDANKVRILFKFRSDLLDQDMEETMWAITINANLGHYQLDSIPFYVPFVATDDIVHAEYDDEEGMLVYQHTVEPSGNSTIWVAVIKATADVEEIRDLFFDLDCISDSLGDRYFVMEVKSKTNYLQIKNKLNELKAEKIIDYTEGCLSVNHQY